MVNHVKSNMSQDSFWSVDFKRGSFGSTSDVEVERYNEDTAILAGKLFSLVKGLLEFLEVYDDSWSLWMLSSVVGHRDRKVLTRWATEYLQNRVFEQEERVDFVQLKSFKSKVDNFLSSKNLQNLDNTYQDGLRPGWFSSDPFVFRRLQCFSKEIDMLLSVEKNFTSYAGKQIEQKDNEIASLQKRLDELIQENKQLSDKLDKEKSRHIEEKAESDKKSMDQKKILEAVIGIQKQEIAELKAVVINKDVKIQVFAADGANKSRALRETNAELANKNSELANKNSELANKNSELANKDSELANKDSELANKDSDNKKEREEKERAISLYNDRKQEIVHLQESVSLLQEQMGQLLGMVTGGEVLLRVPQQAGVRAIEAPISIVQEPCSVRPTLLWSQSSVPEELDVAEALKERESASESAEEDVIPCVLTG